MKRKSIIFAVFLSIFTAISVAKTNDTFTVGLNTNDSFSTTLNVNNKKEDNKKENAKNELEIKMIDLHSKQGGDSTLITYKDKHILIDAGGAQNSGIYIYNALKDIKRLDYLIFTHFDSDHVLNFYYNPKIGKSMMDWFDDGGTVGTLIDFMAPAYDEYFKTNYYQGDLPVPGLNVYTNYVQQKEAFKKKIDLKTGKPKIENDISAAELYANGNSFLPLDKSGKNGIRILYNYFYDHLVTEIPTGDHGKHKGVNESAIKNNISVCCTIEVGGKVALFTGDLEEYISQDEYTRYYGETFLVEANYEYLKNGVDFFKAGHHGSDTSNTELLLDVIRPKYIGISACMARKDDIHSMYKGFGFPKAQALRAMGKWTDYIYINDVLAPNEIGNDVAVPYYGDIIYRYDVDKDKEAFTSSWFEDSDKSSYYPGTRCVNGLIDEVLLERRSNISLNVFTLGEEEEEFAGISYYNASGKNRNISSKDLKYDDLKADVDAKYSPKTNKSENKAISNCTYIKFGHIDILINYGTDIGLGPLNYNNVKKIDLLCNDHVLDYLIVSNYCASSFNGLINKKGLLEKSDIKKVSNLFHFGYESLGFDKNHKREANSYLLHKKVDSRHVYNADSLNNKTINIISNGKFTIDFNFLDMPYTNSTPYMTGKAPFIFRENSLMFNVEMKAEIPDGKKVHKQNFKYTNIGPIINSDQIEMIKLNKDNISKLANTDVVDFMSHGWVEPSNSGSFYSFYHDVLSDPDKLFNGTNLYQSNDSNEANNIPIYPNGVYYKSLKYATSNVAIKEKDKIRYVYYHNLITTAMMGAFIGKGQSARIDTYGSNQIDYVSKTRSLTYLYKN